LKATRQKSSARPAPARRPGRSPAKTGGLAKLRARLGEAEETLRAIRTGEVDTVMVAGKEGSQVFTLEGAEYAYRVLIESMNEGALMLTADKIILYANQRFARMVNCPLEQVTGSSFRRFLSKADLATFRPLMKRTDKSGSKIQVLLHAVDGSKMPAQISIRPLAKNGGKSATFGMVVTDMTEARRNEEMLRTLTHRVVQAQETERGRVALELHDNITQLLCAVLVRSQTLADKLSPSDGPSKTEAIKLRELLGETAEEVERISRNLRPGVLDELGLVAVLHNTSTKFADRMGISIKLACVQLIVRLPADTELALYRILQEALKNVEQHARARHVTVRLTKQGDTVQLVIKDDGIGFDPDHRPARRKEKGGLGLLGMRERATYVGGTLMVKSAPGKGSTVTAQMPLIDRTSGGRSSANRVR
jgi:PAS domain S-box-containing protein